MRPERIVSGGQTGVDRAALDVARDLGLARGGWCPAGRAAEDGPIPPEHPLRETPSADPAERTAWNVRDSDATLILARGELAGGSALSAREAQARKRPLRVVRLDVGDPGVLDQTRAWLARYTPPVLNVAGPRESEDPGVGAAAARFLRELLAG
jgi:hypothetical protein